jgi:hypothetical protein
MLPSGQIDKASLPNGCEEPAGATAASPVLRPSTPPTASRATNASAIEPTIAITNCTASVTTTPQMPDRIEYRKVMPRQKASACHFCRPSVPPSTLAMPRFTQPIMIRLSTNPR